METVMELESMPVIIDIIKIYFISICTYYMELKLTNNNIDIKYKRLIFILMNVCMFSIAIISKTIKEMVGFSYGMLSMVFLISYIFFKTTKRTYSYSLVVTLISLSINYILFGVSIFIGFVVYALIGTKNVTVNIIIIVLMYLLMIKYFIRIKRFKKGINFLKDKLQDEYLNLIVLNISIMILFLIIILSNYTEKITGQFGVGLIIFSIIMFITIKKSLEMYYKQKLLIQDLEETKKELEDEKHENKELEKEILEYSKKSHSIAHKQKALEYKLNELMLKSEVASEIGLQDELSKISKEIQKDETVVELTKTGILEIDDMLKYMQSECTKNKIDFQLKVSGNIHYMVNNYVDKENLEILIADHIKNAIIAIQNSSNANKSILVRLGIIDGYYSLYIYDSGIEFEIETLKNLGKKPSTTHKDTGGTGMRFMNTFETLNKFKASIIIKEYNKPVKDNFTKLITIKFDNKNEYKIYSYRAQEIRKEVKNHELEIEDI